MTRWAAATGTVVIGLEAAGLAWCGWRAADASVGALAFGLAAVAAATAAQRAQKLRGATRNEEGAR